MVALNIRKLDPQVRQRLKERAARHGVSMEEEVRRILSRAVAVEEPESLASVFLTTFGPKHGVDLPLPPRDEMPRDPFAETC